jgi:23S rRNA pseudouridine955/2504/2580 synthase
MIKITKSIVSEDISSIRIDKYLAERFTYLSRTEWQKEIKIGRISLNDKIINNSHKKLQSNDIIEYSGREIVEPEIDPGYSIIFEDDDIIIVDKSGDIPVHPSGRYFHNTLLHILENDLKEKLYPAHRLDRETSGVIIFTKNKKIASILQKNISNIKKTYLAIVYGTLSESELTVDTSIGSAINSKIRKKREAYPGAGEKAITRVKKIYSFGKYTLVKVYPETGRLHQIRVHLNYAGFPILGDKLYGLDENYFLDFIDKGLTSELLSKLKLHRSALHAYSISFSHPVTEESIFLKTQFPEDFKKFMNG